MDHQALEAVMEYDAQGDLVIHIPRQLLTQHRITRIVFKLEEASPGAALDQTTPDWDGDPLLDLVGRFKADMSDGSLRHGLQF